MLKIPQFLTIRVIGLALLPLLFTSCYGEGGDQLHGMLHVDFPSTAVCQAQQKSVPFRNVSGSEIVIDGVAISGGTDPLGNFKLIGVNIGSEQTEAVAGILNDIHVPANTIYSFIVSYTPRTENEVHTAVLDIAYTQPKAGIIQVDLEGASTGRAPSCPTGGGGGGGGAGAGDLDGTLTITINRIALVSSALQLPISTDPDNTVTPFEPVTVPVTLSASANTVTLPAIPEGANFKLPRTLTPPLSNIITEFTTVTSLADASGAYEDDGSLTVENVTIHLKEKFQADFVVTLTTKSVTIPNNLPKNLLNLAGFSLTDDQSQIFGSLVDAETHEVILVGIATFSNPSGTGTVAATIGGTAGAVIIEAKINTP